MSKYKKLVILAQHTCTDIWLADDEGFLVQKETGEMKTSLLPGNYFVQFGESSLGFPFELREDLELSEEELCCSQTPSKPNLPNV